MWDDAYIEQARSDWGVYQVLVKNACSACHQLHYLQMTVEKLGKAALLRSGIPLHNVRGTHRAFVRFMQLSARSRALQREFRMNARQLQAYIQGLLPIANQIERLAPALAQGGPNAEYPWEVPTGQVLTPASYRFPIAQNLKEQNGRKLLLFIKILLEKFDHLF